jgi:uracil-DNA glycosylase family 4
MNPCRLCPRRHNPVPPSGPGHVGGPLFIGEVPNRDEVKYGIPFVGKAGQELDDHYLPIAGLRRDNCDFTYSLKCQPPASSGKLDTKKSSDMELLQACAEAHLFQEIYEKQPSILVPLGALACRIIDPSIHLDVQHGFPVPTIWGIPAFPMFHPNSGLHEPKKMLHIRTDYIRLRAYLAGRLVVPRDEHPTVDYAEVTDASEFKRMGPVTRHLACDTESSQRRGAFCLTYSTAPGTGRLIRASRPDLLAAFQRALDKWRGPILWHNWLHDYKVVPNRLIRDTMLFAFHLGNLPQGLKALSWRELGMEMSDFEDVVTPHAIVKVIEYYRQMQGIEWGKPEEELVRDDKTGLWKLYKPQSLNTKLKRFFTDFGKNPEKDVFQMWTKNWADMQDRIEAELGPWPGLDVADAPFEEVLPYACRDADALGRLWPKLLEMRRRVRKYPQERWRVA